MTGAPAGNVRRLIVLLGLAVTVTACSAVTGLPEHDRSADVRAEPEREDVAVAAPRPEPPIGSRPEAAGHLASRRRQSVVGIAGQHLGAPYRWGGSSPAGFDCSGFVRYVYARVGVSLPHNAAEQYRYGAPVSRDRLEPGDLVFFDRLRHNGIYIGGGRFIHARRSGKRVSIATLDDDWYATRWIGARRL